MSAEAVDAFLSAMDAAGVRPAEPIASALCQGRMIRFDCEGERKGRKGGWAVLHLDGRPAGEFGWHRGGVREKWKADGVPELSASERRRLRDEWQRSSRERERQRQQLHRDVAGEATQLWNAAGLATSNHAYLVRKALPGEALRQEGSRLIVPMFDVEGRLWNLQRIAPDGFKSFLRGGRVSGLMCIIGNGGNHLCLGEGYATMAAVRMATALPCAVAFSGENLLRVAQAIRRRWPHLVVTICADDDRHLVDHPTIQKNMGLEYARAAAAAIGARLALPRQEAR